MNKKFLIGVITILTLTGLLVFKNRSNSVHNEYTAENKDKVRGEDSKFQIDQASKSHLSVQSKIDLLEQQAEEISMNALEIGGLSEPTIFSYDEDWCIAHLDLSKEDQHYEYSQRQSWLEGQRRGQIVIENGEVVHEDTFSYLSLSVETLKQYAKNDDVVALRVLSRRKVRGVDSETARQATKRLLVLGNFLEGLTPQILSEFVKANAVVDSKPDVALQHVIRAMGYVELGFRHGSVYGLDALLEMLKGNPKLRAVVSKANDVSIANYAGKLADGINQERLSDGLAPFDDIAQQRAALSFFQTRIVQLYESDKEGYALLQDKTLLPTHWNDVYLNTPCIKRQIATREAEFHQLPAIRQQIAQLQSQLDALNNSQ